VKNPNFKGGPKFGGLTIFDPQRIFNPHKKTDASLEYAMKFIKKDNEHTV